VFVFVSAATAEHQSGIKGVRWNEKQLRWEAYMQVNGKKSSKVFTANKFGFEESKRLAINWRKGGGGSE
jgi:hypothetical protein